MLFSSFEGLLFSVDTRRLPGLLSFRSRHSRVPPFLHVSPPPENPWTYLFCLPPMEVVHGRGLRPLIFRCWLAPALLSSVVWQTLAWLDARSLCMALIHVLEGSFAAFGC